MSKVNLSKFTTFIPSKDGGGALIFNTRSENADILPKHLAHRFKGKWRGFSDEVLGYLHNRGYIIGEEMKQDESVFVKKLLEEFDQKISTLPGSYVIAPTLGCNFKCDYCFQDHDMHKLKSVMSTSELMKVFKTIEEIEGSRNAECSPEFLLFGGEPLQCNPTLKENLKYILKKCKEYKSRLSIVTNGYDLLYFQELLTSDVIKTIQVTLDGDKQVHDNSRVHELGIGTYDRIMEGLRALVPKGSPINIRINLSFDNLNDINDLLESLDREGFFEYDNFSVYFGYIQSFNDNYIQTYTLPDLIDATYELRKKYPLTEQVSHKGCGWADFLVKLKNKGEMNSRVVKYCGASTNMLCFASDGLVYTCTDAIGDKSMAVGKFIPELELDNDALAIWREQDIQSSNICSKCKVSLTCGGGCTYKAIKKNGDPYDTICEEVVPTLGKLMPHYESL